MKKNKMILFDWDDTLFNKTEFKKKLSENLADKCGILDSDILEIQEKYINNLGRSDDFRIDNFLEYLGQKFNKKIDLKDFTSDNLKIYSQSVFPKTAAVLDQLKSNFKLGIYSQGFEDFQKIKIESSGIKVFFDDNLIYINKNKLDDDLIQKIPKGTIIIDDKKEVVEKLSELKKFELVWINRKNEEKIEGIKTIKSLEEIVDLIQ